MTTDQRAPVVGVMGGSDVPDDVLADAEELGRLVARRGWVLLNGGRDAGVMAASARGAAEAGGTVVGVLPHAHEGDWPVSPHLTIRVLTGMGDARNVVNVLSSDVVVACPGGAGTISEVALALKNDRPVVLMGLDDRGLFADGDKADLVHVADGPEDAVRLVAEILERGPP